jgi:hypothetical protein
MTKTDLMDLKPTDMLTIKAGAVQDLLVRLDVMEKDYSNLVITNNLLRQNLTLRNQSMVLESIDLDN